MSNKLSSMNSDVQAQIWFYYTRGMIQGLCDEHKVPKAAQVLIINQFNKIGPKLGIKSQECE